MPQTYNRGGQRRTTEAGCGFTAVGSVRECAGKMRLHQKVCAICSQQSTFTTPPHNAELGTNNGWKGINVKGNCIKKDDMKATLTK